MNYWFKILKIAPLESCLIWRNTNCKLLSKTWVAMPAQSRLVWMNVPPHPYPLYLTLFTNFSHIFCSIYECVNILFRHVGTWPSIWYQEKRDWSFKLGAKRVLISFTFKYLLSKNLLIDYTCRSKNVYCTAIDPHSATYKS